MSNFELISSISKKTSSKIVFLVVDGLGGLIHHDIGMTELEAASTPNLDRLARTGTTGLTIPVEHGVTPGSGPGHLALFGYDPFKYQIGRGILEALGLEMQVGQNSIAGRGNYCLLDAEGKITDRRAGRLSTEQNLELTETLSNINIDGTTIDIKAGKEHRAAIVFNPTNDAKFSDQITDSDPQQTNVFPNQVKAITKNASETASIIQSFLEQANTILRESSEANGIILRGFSSKPKIPLMKKIYKLNPVCIASYPMYKGLSQMLGMSVAPTGDTFADQLDTLEDQWENHDFFFVHYKPTDSAGEDGNFTEKVNALESLDQELPKILQLDPDVLVVAGDHSTPSVMAGHSWHPVPFVISSAMNQNGETEKFTEREAKKGALGTIQATDLMPLALAHSGKLEKFGA